MRSIIQSVVVGDSVIVKDSSGFHSGEVVSVSSAVVEIKLSDFDDDSGDSGAACCQVVSSAGSDCCSSFRSSREDRESCANCQGDQESWPKA